MTWSKRSRTLKTASAPSEWERVCDIMHNQADEEGCLGFDIEYFAPMTKGLPNAPVALLSFCTSQEAPNPTCALFQLWPPTVNTAKVHLDTLIITLILTAALTVQVDQNKPHTITTGRLPECIIKLFKQCKLAGVNVNSDITLMSKFYPDISNVSTIELSDLAKALAPDLAHPAGLTLTITLTNVTLIYP